MELFFTVLLALVLMLSATAGSVAQRRLSERHVSRDSVESVRLLMAMLVTFSALVLGLLTSTAKQRFDDYNNDLVAYGTQLTELDYRLRGYGTEADAARKLLRSYTAASIADTWPGEPAPSGQYPHLDRTAASGEGMEGTKLGDMLTDVDQAIERLAPSDGFHRQIADRLHDRIVKTIDQRWRLIFSARSTVSWPFLLILSVWLATIFAIFGLTAPRNLLIYVVVGLSAVSIASPMYLILEYNGVEGGLVQMSSRPMLTALSHMDRPD